MQQSNRELWYALFAVIVISLLYLFVVIMFNGIPGASELFGHGIGILGFLLMLSTETLYSLRKRSRRARWGRMSSWLQFHIFTGLVGPFLVLLHSSWKFNGLAGIVMLLTIIIVASGFFGRYIYTSVPRNLDGIEIEAYQLEQQIVVVESELQHWLKSHPDSYSALSNRFKVNRTGSGARLVLGRVFEEWNARLKWWQESRKLDDEGRTQAQQLNQLLRRQRVLQRQQSSIVLTRRLLSLWHTIHIPIGIALFTAAFIHITAAIYYANLLH